MKAIVDGLEVLIVLFAISALIWIARAVFG